MNRPSNGRDILLYVLSLLKGTYPFLIAGLGAGLLFLLRIPDEVWIVLAVILSIGLLFYFRYADWKKMKQRTFESLSPEMKSEIDRERRANLTQRQKFLDAMEKAGGGKIV